MLVSTIHEVESFEGSLCTTEYKFAVYNVQPNSYTYTQEEYTRWLGGMYDSATVNLSSRIDCPRQGMDEGGNGLPFRLGQDV